MRLYLDAQSSSTPAVIGIWNSYGALSSGWFSDQEIVTQNDTPHFLVLQGASTDPVPFTFRVLPGNHQPTLPALGNLSLDEETSLNINTGATDFESSNDVLAYSLGAGAPTGMSIDSATGKLTWTPTDLQGQGQYQVTVIVQDDGVPPLRDSRTFSITVNEVNEKPVLAAIPDFTLDEGGTVSFQASATDGDLPAQPLAYSLGAGAPAGASIDSATGQFLWKTTEAQGPGEHQVTVVVTDTDPGAINGEHLTDSKTFKVTVNEVNEAPVLPTIADKTLDEGGTYVFTSTATDVDLPANKLTYSLTAGPPSATIGTDGKIRWTTTESDGPGTYTFTVKVQDDGQPSLNDTKSFKVTLKEVNAAPVLPGIATETIVHAGQKVAINATASDSDIPANKLTYTLTPGNVVGVSFDKNTGLLSWTPSGAQVGDYPFEVTETDDGVPAASDSASFTIRVKPPPELSLSVSGAVATLEWNAVAGTTYKVQFKDDLSAASWTLLREVTATGVTATTTDSIGPGKQRFYRVAIED
jgi:hypothetical protein